MRKTITMNSSRFASAVALSAFFLAVGTGCGGPPVPPAELTNARAELLRAKNGPANQLDPTDVHEASVALDRAEHAFSENPDAPNTIDLSRIAQLKAETAEAKASTMQAELDKTRAEQAFKDQQTSRLQNAQGQLQAAQGQLQNTQTDLVKTQEQLEREKAQRAKAEEALKAARLTLAQIASVKDDERGMVVTFQGEALFKTAKSELLPGAMAKLDRVSETLKGQERKIVISGHTDNVGGDTAYNQDLSEKRANAVKTYLVSKGVPQDLITAEGHGPSQPVGDNKSTEGRAMNRRVEIIVQPPAAGGMK